MDSFHIVVPTRWDKPGPTDVTVVVGFVSNRLWLGRCLVLEETEMVEFYKESEGAK